MGILIWVLVGVVVGFFVYKVLDCKMGKSNCCEDGGSCEGKSCEGKSCEGKSKEQGSSSAKATEDKNIREVKEGRKEKVLEMLADPSNTSGQVTNDDVEKALGVSDASATNYLTELEQEGHIKQIGETGRSVYYTKQ